MNERARSFRKNMTEAEKKLWYYLRDRRLEGSKFIRQYVIDCYIADFVCREKKLIVEVDGSLHAEAFDYDQERTLFLRQKGYQVVRFWNNEVMQNINGVLMSIKKTLEMSQAKNPHPSLRADLSRERER